MKQFLNSLILFYLISHWKTLRRLKGLSFYYSKKIKLHYLPLFLNIHTSFTRRFSQTIIAFFAPH